MWKNSVFLAVIVLEIAVWVEINSIYYFWSTSQIIFFFILSITLNLTEMRIHTKNVSNMTISVTESHQR